MTFDSPTDPYRTAGYVPPKPKEKKPMKIPYIAYVAGIASCFVSAGVSCDHLNDFANHPNITSATSIGVTFGFMTIAGYIGVILAKKLGAFE